MKRLIIEVAVCSLVMVGVVSAQEGGMRLTANVVTPPAPVVIEPPVEAPVVPETPPVETLVETVAEATPINTCSQ